MESIPQYTHQPLSGLENIRTLTLRGTKIRVECTIQETSILVGGYEALSYVWGAEEKPFQAVVVDEDGQPIGYIPLTRNLHNALCDLRDAEELGSKIFWIDQICINQEGDEKNYQVALMGQIYSNAARVITYLGPAGPREEEEQGISLLRRLHAHFSPNYDTIYETGSLFVASEIEMPVSELPLDLLQDENVDGYVDQGWRWLLGVAFGDWTRRLWMTQEQLLNQEIVMLRGPKLLQWNAVALVTILFAIELLPLDYLSRFNKEMDPEVIFNLNSITEAVWSLWYDRAKSERSLSIKKQSLLNNMYFYENLDCRDPRDRVYALLAISNDAAELGLAPDYSESATVALTSHHLSIRALQTSPDLNLLCYATRWGQDSDLALPSWSLTLTRANRSHRNFLIPQKWSLIPNMPSNVRFQLNHTNLILKGRIIDYVSLSTPCNMAPESLLIDREEALTEAVTQLVLGFFTILHRIGVSLSSAAHIAFAMIAGRGLHSSSETEKAAVFFWLIAISASDISQNAPQLEDDLSRITEQCDYYLKELRSMFPEPSSLDEEYNPRAFGSEAEMFQNMPLVFNEFRSNSTMRGRSLCVTRGGHICNAMNEVKEGDVVAAFQGADRLYILRPVEDKNRLIGDAFIDGLMFGEAYQNLDPDDVGYDIVLI